MTSQQEPGDPFEVVRVIVRRCTEVGRAVTHTEEDAIFSALHQAEEALRDAQLVIEALSSLVRDEYGDRKSLAEIAFTWGNFITDEQIAALERLALSTKDTLAKGSDDGNIIVKHALDGSDQCSIGIAHPGRCIYVDVELSTEEGPT